MNRHRQNVIPTEKELSTLIRESRRDKILQVGMGTGRLFDIPENDWAFKRLEEMRTKTIDVGEGI
jgi:hypothetical protein